MKNVFFIFFLMSITLSIYSQGLEFEILKLTISNIQKAESDVVLSHDNHGPDLDFEFRILNKTDSTISLYPSRARYILKFFSESIPYECEFFPLAFMDNVTLDIPSGQVIGFEASNWVFLGTPIHSIKKNDYLIDLIRILPTMEFEYRDKIHMLSASRVKNVVIK